MHGQPSRGGAHFHGVRYRFRRHHNFLWRGRLYSHGERERGSSVEDFHIIARWLFSMSVPCIDSVAVTAVYVPNLGGRATPARYGFHPFDRVFYYGRRLVPLWGARPRRRHVVSQVRVRVSLQAGRGLRCRLSCHTCMFTPWSIAWNVEASFALPPPCIVHVARVQSTCLNSHVHMYLAFLSDPAASRGPRNKLFPHA